MGKKLTKSKAGSLKNGGGTTQITIIKNERGDITIDFMYIRSLMKEYYKQLYVHKLDNLDKTKNSF